jgi:hypothetical protein
MANILANLQKQVQVGRKIGTRCPCCKRYVREYERRISGSMVWALALVYDWYRKNDTTMQTFIKVDEYLRDIKGIPLSVMRGDFTKLPHWGLVERQKAIRKVGSDRAGYYRITNKGVQFLLGALAVPEFIVILDAKKIRESLNMVKIDACLTKKFNYQELMSIIS